MGNMKIYTKTGDGGETSLFGGKRVSKDSLVISQLGWLDHLNSQIGMVLSYDDLGGDDHSICWWIQDQLYFIMSYIGSERTLKKELNDLEEIVSRVEKRMDIMSEYQKPLHNFIKPFGSAFVCELHRTRTLIRLAEPKFIKEDKRILMFLNRLSDYFFVLARHHSRNEFPFPNSANRKAA